MSSWLRSKFYDSWIFEFDDVDLRLVKGILIPKDEVKNEKNDEPFLLSE